LRATLKSQEILYRYVEINPKNLRKHYTDILSILALAQSNLKPKPDQFRILLKTLSKKGES